MLKISENYSKGVKNEISSLENSFEYKSEIKNKSLEQILSEWGFNLANFQEIADEKLKLKILDIGVGKGESTLYLSSLGHDVSCVEPFVVYCENLEYLADKFGLNIEIYNGVAESLNKIDDEFDYVIFNASLHHCDDPVLALNYCKSRLRSGGKLMLYSETFLRPWQTKKWFQKKLQENPIEMGHYGGNEHAYYNWEYINMLKKSGFNRIKTLRPSNGSVLDKVEYRIRRRVENKRIDNSPLKLIARIIYYIIEEKISNIEFFRKVSICSSNFIAFKN